MTDRARMKYADKMKLPKRIRGLRKVLDVFADHLYNTKKGGSITIADTLENVKIDRRVTLWVLGKPVVRYEFMGGGWYCLTFPYEPLCSPDFIKRRSMI